MKNNDYINDENLRALLKEHARQSAPPSPWFTKKVMNRLPPRRVRTVAVIEYAVYAVAAVLTAIFATIYGIDCYRSGVVTIGNLTLLAIYFGIFASIIWLGVSPWLEEERPDAENIRG